MPDLDQMSELDTILREAAGDAARGALQLPYDDVRDAARRRRHTKVATAGAFGVVLSLVVAMAAVAGLRGGPGPDGRPPAASSAALDPSLQQYVTTIPVLAWAPVDGRTAASVTKGAAFLNALFDGVRTEAHMANYWPDLRKPFPDAPIGGNAVVFAESFSRSELERAAANMRKLDGVKYARVVDVKGLWFTLWASAPATSPSMHPMSIAPSVSVRKPGSSHPAHSAFPTVPHAAMPIDLHDLGFSPDAAVFQMVFQNDRPGGLTGSDTHAVSIRVTFVGPSLTRADFDLIRSRAAAAVHIDVSKVVVKAESAAPGPQPTK